MAQPSGHDQRSLIASSSESAWDDWQRGYDYYGESALLIWLDADTLIREGTRGRRSLDDFARGFFGGSKGELGPKLYRFEDVVAALNAVYPFDWRAFLRERLDRTGATVPLDGLARSGWKLAFANKRSEMGLAAPTRQANAGLAGVAGVWCRQGRQAQLRNVGLPGVPRWPVTAGPDCRGGDAGLQCQRPEAAIEANKDGAKPIELLLKRGDDYRIVTLDVLTGLRYPVSSGSMDDPIRWRTS